jgi:tryptophan-rich sensory protein
MKTTARSALGLAAILAITAVAPVLGAKSSRPDRWYRRLRKPRHTPPSWVFGPVWTTLYAASAIAAWRVWRSAPSAARTRTLALWGVQHALNAAWSPLFFGAHRTRAALADVGALLATSAAFVREARGVDRTASWLMTPYVGWIAYASSLNAGVVMKNA